MNRKQTKQPTGRVQQTLAALALAATATTATAGEDADPPEIAIGERLFLETRFAQAHAADPDQGDAVVERTVTVGGHLPGPFAGKAQNCRACHLVDEQLEQTGGGMRAYADFARLSPQPARQDGVPSRPRNAQALVNAAVPREPGVLFHFDGQFASLEDLAGDTLIGREYGWLAGEQDTARAHVARVIRDDDGQDELAQEFGGSYREVLKGAAADDDFQLPAEYRIDVDQASDAEILNAVARLIAAYVRDLNFERDDQGRYTGSPYDHFLEANKLPRQPDNNESPRDYGGRLLQALHKLDKPKFIAGKKFEFHHQDFAFGKTELAGLKLFLTEGKASSQHAGNCIACHAPPHFTDFGFHNTGIAQRAYDKLHGDGAFAKLEIPGLTERRKNHAAWLPATEQHPEASDRFRTIPAADKPGYTDLGLWNVFANPDFPNPQPRLKQILCEAAKHEQDKADTDCSDAALLPATVARVKTPGLRDLGHSDPYMHNGSLDKLDDVLNHYLSVAPLQRTGKLRNGAPELAGVHITAVDIAPLRAFLGSLNEDYN